MTNRPCSYFLPKAILETSLVETVDGEIDIYKPVYSCDIQNLDWKGAAVDSIFWEYRFLCFGQLL